MLRFQVETDGAVTIDRAFNRVQERLTDLRKDIWPAAAEAFRFIEQDQFQSEGSKGASGEWSALSPKYEEWRAKHFTPFPFILYRTGDLKKSLSYKGAKGSIYDAQPLELTLGSSIPYARYHMTAYKNRPARPPISLTEKQKRDLMKAIQKELVQYVRKQGFVQTDLSDVA